MPNIGESEYTPLFKFTEKDMEEIMAGWPPPREDD